MVCTLPALLLTAFLTLSLKGQPVKCLTVRNLPVEKKLLLVENEFITPITDLKPDIFGSKPLLQDSKELGLVSGLEEDLITLNASKNQIKKDLINQTNEDLTKQADNAIIEEELVEDNNSSASKDFSESSAILTTNEEANINLASENNTNETYDISDDNDNSTDTTTSTAVEETDTAKIATTDQAIILKESSNITGKPAETSENTSAIKDITTSPVDDITTTTVEETTTFDDNTTTTVNTNDNGDDERSHPLPSWAYALISIAIAALLISVLFFFFLKYRRRQIPLAKPITSMLRKSTIVRSPQPIRIKEFHNEYQIRLSNFAINEEFERVQEHSARINASKSRKIGQDEKNRNRNRFVDIIPFDENLVLLGKEEGHPASNYINASYIEDVPGISKVIATQGPKQNTVVEFWRMILEKGCKHIINLTNTMEGGRVKCYQYWPPNGQMLHFDDISLFTQEEIEINPGLFLRKIEVQMGDEEDCDTETIEQLHLTTWPDHSVPSNLANLLEFIKVTEGFGETGYTVVHCSAGVGRTGTYLALRSLIHQTKQEEEVDVMKTVFKLRSQRPKLVQTFEQYALLYQVLSAYLAKEGGLADDYVDISGDIVLDAGIDNFGFEHVKL